MKFDDKTGFDFGDITSAEVHVRNLHGNDYVLREPTEETAAKWKSFNARQAKFKGGKMVGVGDLGDGQAFLLSMCLWEQPKPNDAYGKERLVPLNVIKGWKAREVTALAKWCMEVGELAEPETREALEERLLELRQKLGAMNVRRGENPDGEDEEPAKNVSDGTMHD